MKMTDISSELKLLGLEVKKAQSAGAINGTGIDCKQDVDGPFESAIAVASLGTAAGTPTAESLVIKIQHSDSSGSGYTDYADESGSTVATATGIASAAPATNDGARIQLAVRLKNAKRYVRIVATLGFTAGTSPTNGVVLGWIVGGGPRVPTTPPNGT